MPSPPRADRPRVGQLHTAHGVTANSHDGASSSFERSFVFVVVVGAIVSRNEYGRCAGGCARVVGASRASSDGTGRTHHVFLAIRREEGEEAVSARGGIGFGLRAGRTQVIVDAVHGQATLSRTHRFIESPDLGAKPVVRAPACGLAGVLSSEWGLPTDFYRTSWHCVVFSLSRRISARRELYIGIDRRMLKFPMARSLGLVPTSRCCTHELLVAPSSVYCCVPPAEARATSRPRPRTSASRPRRSCNEHAKNEVSYNYYHY